MANYVPYVRSNYFKVKNIKAFKSFIDEFDMRFISKKTIDEEVLVGFYIEDDSSIPESRYDEESAEDMEFNFYKELSTHLEEGWVAEIREIGFEKMRYLTGYSVAVNHKGEEITSTQVRFFVNGVLRATLGHAQTGNHQFSVHAFDQNRLSRLDWLRIERR